MKTMRDLSDWLVNADPEKEYVLEVKQSRKKRSLDANAYFWVLVDKLAAAINISKTEVYRNAVRDIGGVSKTGCFLDEDVQELRRLWECKGLGWLTETTPSKLAGCTNITFYKGSSEYDTKQMARLIDNVVQDCEAVGIETASPEEIERLLHEREEYSARSA